MPFAGFKDFKECLKKQQENGYDLKTSKKICGKLQAEFEVKSENKKDNKTMKTFEFNKYLPISKINSEEQIVYGYASTPDLDSQGEIVEIEALKEALPNYMKFPTIREMHTTNAVGRTRGANIDEKGLFISAKIVDDNAWKKVKEGVFNGFSIGGRVKQMVDNVIKSLDLTEISLVDVPANKNAVITLFKADEINEVYSKYHSLVNMSASELEAWSKTECSKKASLSRSPINRNLNLLRKKKSDWTMSDVTTANRTISFISRMRGAEQGEKVGDCPSKRDISLKNWGYNPNKTNKTNKVKKIKKAEQNFKVGDFVEWNSSGGIARGKITRIIREGSVNIPDSNFTITAEKDNPALLIRVYRKDENNIYKPTDKIVGHKANSVKRTTAIKFINLNNFKEVSQFKMNKNDVNNDKKVDISEVSNDNSDNQEVLISDEVTEVDTILKEFSEEDENLEETTEVTEEDVETDTSEDTEETDETEETEDTEETNEIKEVSDEPTDLQKSIDKINQLENKYNQKIEKINTIEKMDKAISKIADLLVKIDERLSKVENTPAETKTKATYLVEKSLGDVEVKKVNPEIEKAQAELDELIKIRETNPDRYALENMSIRAFQLLDKIRKN